MNDKKRLCLYDEQQLATVLDRMAGQLAGLLSGDRDVILLGVLRRGVPLASLLAERLHGLGVRPAQRVDLEVKRYGDDLTLLYPETLLRENTCPRDFDLSGKTVVVVDDVLYRGHSLLRVVQYLALRGAAEIRSAILVDRGVSLLPIHADVCGLRLDVAPGSIVEVHVPPYESDLSIVLVPPDR
jgi:pyrimidine operon attenuation protein/uracil phosphoribosyltransferase